MKDNGNKLFTLLHLQSFLAKFRGIKKLTTANTDRNIDRGDIEHAFVGVAHMGGSTGVA